MIKPDIKNRQEQLSKTLLNNGLKAIALNPGPDLTYFTGLDFHLMERPVIGVFPAGGLPFIILPQLEQAKLDKLDFEINPFFYNEDQSLWPAVMKTAFSKAGLLSGKLGVIPHCLRLLELRYLEAASPELEVVSAQDLVASLRMIKGNHEIELMQEAARIAECALAATLSAIKPGATEKEIASKLVGRLLHHGSDPELPFFPIVAFGENSANPHATPTDRVLKSGELVLIDWGANAGGYYSDITRTFALGDIHPELEKVAEFVRKANAAGRAAVKAGVKASSIDQAARKVIEEAGYGEFFIHRTGHGLGRETHEEPYISQYNHTELVPGMTFTIEPGIYLPNRGGVRIEDDVMVTEDGCTTLTHLPRELSQLFIEE
ncbi:MAG: aminopeptidase P family protein [Anaerolineales bacterium]